MSELRQPEWIKFFYGTILHVTRLIILLKLKVKVKFSLLFPPLCRGFMIISKSKIKVTVKCSRYRPGVAQRVGRGIALLFHDRGTVRGWVVSSTPRPHFTPGKDPVPILQKAGWASGPVWTGGKSRPYRDSVPERPAHSQSLYRLSHRARLIILYPII